MMFQLQRKAITTVQEQYFAPGSLREDFIRITLWISLHEWLQYAFEHADVQSYIGFLIYFELPKPLNVPEDTACTLYPHKNKWNPMCENTADSKLGLPSFIYPLFVQ